MFILDILKKVLSIGKVPITQIASAYNPALGMLVDTVFSAILNAEAKGGSGTDKKEIAVLGVQVAGPAIAGLFERQGKGIKNAELFARGTDKLMEGIVDILNSTGDRTK